MTLEKFLANANLKNVTGHDGQYTAKCPAHDDAHASLSISEGGDGRILLNCHAGCTAEQITAAVGMKMNDLFPEKPAAGKRVAAEYNYCNESEKMLFKKIRYEPKGFSQARPDGKGGWIYNLKGIKPVLYRLPEVLKAVADRRTIYFVEGEKDAETLWKRGLAATTSPGGAKAKWEKQYGVPLSGADVMILGDNDDAGKEYAQKAAWNLHGIAGSVKLIDLTLRWPDLPPKADITDVFEREKNDAAVLAALAGLAADTPEYSPTQALQADPVRCDAGFADLFRGSDYIVVNGILRGVSDGKPLANFVAWIESEKMVSNGEERKKCYVIAGKLASGKDLPAITVPVDEFRSLNWVNEMWNSSCNISPGPTVRDKLRHCTQQISRSVRSETEFTHTGWHHDPQNGWTFLSGGESVGIPGAEVALPGKLKGYSFPAGDSGNLQDAAAALRLTEIAPRNVTLPLLAVTFLSALNEFLKQAGYEPRFVTALIGRTNSGKSTLAALFLSFFGNFTGGTLPMSFQDTANSVIEQGFLLKDVLTCVDDFKPGTGADNVRMLNLAQMMMRSWGERQGRSRLTADSSLKQNHPPRGNVVITGEQAPDVGESGIARCITLELHPGDVDFKKLTAAQREAAEGVFTRCMKAFLLWLKEKWLDKDPQAFVKQLGTEFTEFRGSLSKTLQTEYPRVIEAFAHLRLGWEYFLHFARETGALPEEDAGALSDEMVEIFRHLLGRYTEYAGDLKPTAMFIRKLSELIRSNSVCVLYAFRPMPDDTPKFIGYYDDECYYFHAELAYEAVVELCRKQGVTFPLGQKALLKQLADAELIVTNGEEKCPRHEIFGIRRRYLTFEKATLDSA